MTFIKKDRVINVVYVFLSILAFSSAIFKKGQGQPEPEQCDWKCTIQAAFTTETITSLIWILSGGFLAFFAYLLLPSLKALMIPVGAAFLTFLAIDGMDLSSIVPDGFEAYQGFMVPSITAGAFLITFLVTKLLTGTKPALRKSLVTPPPSIRNSKPENDVQLMMPVGAAFLTFLAIDGMDLSSIVPDGFEAYQGFMVPSITAGAFLITFLVTKLLTGESTKTKAEAVQPEQQPTTIAPAVEAKATPEVKVGATPEVKVVEGPSTTTPAAPTDTVPEPEAKGGAEGDDGSGWSFWGFGAEAKDDEDKSSNEPEEIQNYRGALSVGTAWNMTTMFHGIQVTKHYPGRSRNIGPRSRMLHLECSDHPILKVSAKGGSGKPKNIYVRGITDIIEGVDADEAEAAHEEGTGMKKSDSRGNLTRNLSSGSLGRLRMRSSSKSHMNADKMKLVTIKTKEYILTVEFSAVTSAEQFIRTMKYVRYCARRGYNPADNKYMGTTAA
eukprot:CAMPEP_0113953260 /NCGR_PEP_ID=MMETSP1339-20121228/90880_1 /TAXON_ID=94617 /ORGANISM="Fibrocapsa japonica" /LENGTH=496 /DNA_ID=CAMNT_0000961981 /DNA_START=56 /DNA_END=1546 /DNA_ORIENTATION=- /assembly_acc=CAM_ASM_000762